MTHHSLKWKTICGLQTLKYAFIAQYKEKKWRPGVERTKRIMEYKENLFSLRCCFCEKI